MTTISRLTDVINHVVTETDKGVSNNGNDRKKTHHFLSVDLSLA